MRLSLRSLAVVAAFAGLSATASAQTPPPAPANVPQPDCTSPGDTIPTSRPGMNTTENFQKKVDAYGKCMKDYVAAMRDKADDLMNQAKAHQDAGNAAVTKYNDYVNALNDQAAKKNR